MCLYIIKKFSQITKDGNCQKCTYLLENDLMNQQIQYSMQEVDLAQIIKV